VALFAFEHHFDLEGIGVKVRTSNPHLSSVLQRQFERRLNEVGGGGDALLGGIEVEIAAGPLPSLPGDRPSFSFPPLYAFPRDGGWFLVDDVGSLQVDPFRGTIRGHLPAEADLTACGRFAVVTLWVAILECLRARGRFALHGAGMVSPAGDLVLLVGSSGSGKTSGAITLLEAGWRTLGDDLLFLERAREHALNVIAHRWDFHVTESLLRRRPRLRPHVRTRPSYEPQNKLSLDQAAAFPGQTVRRWTGPAEIFFPRVVDGASGRDRVMTPRSALLQLFPQSPFVVLQPQLVPGHLAALKLLVDNAPATPLRCGPDVFLNPGAYLSLIEESRCRSAALA
jgi:hypothetical protein